MKSKETKMKEVQDILTKLNSLGLSPQHEGIKEFYTVLKKYKDEDLSLSGKIRLLGLKREIHYILPVTPNKQVSVELKYNKFV
jgi:hypothetical protein